MSGGIATGFLKILEKFLGKAKDKAEFDSGIRSELRLDLDRKLKELVDLRAETDELEQEAERWRADYWSLFESFVNLRMLSYQAANIDPALKEKIDAIITPHQKRLADREKNE